MMPEHADGRLRYLIGETGVFRLVRCTSAGAIYIARAASFGQVDPKAPRSSKLSFHVRNRNSTPGSPKRASNRDTPAGPEARIPDALPASGIQRDTGESNWLFPMLTACVFIRLQAVSLIRKLARAPPRDDCHYFVTGAEPLDRPALRVVVGVCVGFASIQHEVVWLRAPRAVSSPTRSDLI
jgi:hypothetical protein